VLLGDLLPEIRVHFLDPFLLARSIGIVDIAYGDIEERAHAAREGHSLFLVGAGRSLDLVFWRDRVDAHCRDELLTFLAEQEFDEGVGSLRMGRSFQHGHRLRRHVGVLREDIFHIVAVEHLGKGHIARHGEAHGKLSLGHHVRYVTGACRKDTRIRCKLFQPFPALFPSVGLENYFIGSVAAA